MHYQVFGSNFCPRCEKAKKALESMGHVVYKRDLEATIEATDDWRDDWNEKTDVMADHALRNLEMPSIRCVETREWLGFEEVCGQ